MKAQRYLADMLRRDPQLSSDPAIDPVKSGSLSQLRRDRFKVNGQVEPHEYESDHTTTFISGQEVFSLSDRKIELDPIAARIRRLRGSQKQEDFAAKIGLDQTTVSKWERGKARPTPEALTRLAAIAEGTDKLFFLEHAGLPKEYFMGEPMVPEILHASDSVVRRAWGRSAAVGRARADQEVLEAALLLKLEEVIDCLKTNDVRKTENAPLDTDLLRFVIETIEAGLRKRQLRLPPDKLADAVLLSYEYCYRTGARDSEMVERLLKIA